MYNFSIVVIAKNEGETLPRLVNSVKEFISNGGEFIVLDTGSTDGTSEIARSLGCVVHEVQDKFVTTLDKNIVKEINKKFVSKGEENIVKQGDKFFNYSDARNYAASLAKNDFIFMPDCDEVLTSFKPDIINQLTKEYDQFEYNFVFAHDENNKPLIQFLHSKFYRKSKMKWERVTHEILSGEGKRLYLTEDVIKLDHYQNTNTPRGHYLKGLAYDCFIDPNSSRNSHYLGRELMYTQRYKSAIQEFERHIQMGKWLTEATQSMIYIGDCYLELKNPAKVMEYYMLSFDREPNRREALMRIAEFYRRHEQPIQTIAFASAASTIQGSNFYANFQPYYTNLPHELMKWGYEVLGNKEKAQEQSTILLKYLPSLPKVSIIIPTLEREQGLEQCLKSISDLNYPQELIEVKVIQDTPRLGVPKRVQESVLSTSGEFIVFAANDMTFDRECLKEAINDYRRTNKRLISFNEGPLSIIKDSQVLWNTGKICTHFMIKRDLLPKIGGEIFCTKMNHLYTDTLLWEKCTLLNEAFHSTNAKITHNHFSKDKVSGEPVQLDEVYQLGYSKKEQDKEIFEQELQEFRTGLYEKEKV